MNRMCMDRDCKMATKGPHTTAQCQPTVPVDAIPEIIQKLRGMMPHRLVLTNNEQAYANGLRDAITAIEDVFGKGRP